MQIDPDSSMVDAGAQAALAGLMRRAGEQIARDAGPPRGASADEMGFDLMSKLEARRLRDEQVVQQIAATNGDERALRRVLGVRG